MTSDRTPGSTTGGDVVTVDDVNNIARELKAYATHFSERDWNYTRDTGTLRGILYDEPYNNLSQRIKRALKEIFSLRRDDWGLGTERFSMAWCHLRSETNMPDGVLDDGNIITHWEETGEYLQFVQPTVGALIAEWLMAEPENAYAKLVAAEMWRIQRRYVERLEGAGSDS